MNRNSRLWFLYLFTFILAASGCATTKIDFEKAGQIDEPEAYEAFLKKHPKGRFSEKARQKIERIRGEKAKAEDTIAAYTEFLETVSHWDDYSGPYKAEAISRVEYLRYEKAKKIDAVDEYTAFIEAHPEGAYTDKAIARWEVLRFQKAKQINSIRIYQDFLKDFPRSRFIPSIMTRIETVIFTNALRSNSEQALRRFIKDFPKSHHYKKAHSELAILCFKRAARKNTDNTYIDFVLAFPASDLTLQAISRLQNYHYKFVTRAKLLPWPLINSIVVTDSSSMSKKPFSCGLKLSEFSKPPEFQSHGKQSVTDGENCFFKPGSIINFKDWTLFSGHMCKGQAVIQSNGLKFLSGAEIIQPKTADLKDF